MKIIIMTTIALLFAFTANAETETSKVDMSQAYVQNLVISSDDCRLGRASSDDPYQCGIYLDQLNDGIILSVEPNFVSVIYYEADSSYLTLKVRDTNGRKYIYVQYNEPDKDAYENSNREAAQTKLNEVLKALQVKFLGKAL